MRTHTTLTAGFAALALAAAPAMAQSGTDNPGTAHHQANGGSANAGSHGHGKAYGKYCQTESKKHVAGQHGTPFSNCVTAMAKVANGSNPTTACKTESKKHVAGQHGTPFSKCVSGAAKLKSDEASSNSSDTTTA